MAAIGCTNMALIVQTVYYKRSKVFRLLGKDIMAYCHYYIAIDIISIPMIESNLLNTTTRNGIMVLV